MGCGFGRGWYPLLHYGLHQRVWAVPRVLRIPPVARPKSVYDFVDRISPNFFSFRWSARGWPSFRSVWSESKLRHIHTMKDLRLTYLRPDHLDARILLCCLDNVDKLVQRLLAVYTCSRNVGRVVKWNDYGALHGCSGAVL